jgi:hypothetical protein
MVGDLREPADVNLDEAGNLEKDGAACDECSGAHTNDHAYVHESSSGEN